MVNQMTELAATPAFTFVEPDFSKELSQLSEISIPVPSPGDQSSGLNLLEMLKADGIEPVTGNEINSIEANNLSAQPASPNSLGDEILARLDAVGANYKQNVNRAYAALEKSPRENTVQDLLKMQLDIAVVSLEVEVVGKGVQKSVQHIDTLSKMN
jgi:hypothetical protein